MELLIFYIVLALGVSFLCSILEAVFFSITLGFVQQEISSGNKYSKKLAKMKEMSLIYIYRFRPKQSCSTTDAPMY